MWQAWRNKKVNEQATNQKTYSKIYGAYIKHFIPIRF